jgi:hypothetical protein
MHDWSAGYTQSELDDAQARYGLRFPPDLVALLLERHPELGYDWKVEDSRIRRMLGWPYEALAFDVEEGFWWPNWGERPNTAHERSELIRGALSQVPQLIPLYSHRFLPETPFEPGNPVFSMHGFDTIYHGSDLTNYLAREFGDSRRVPVGHLRKHIDFWTDIVEGFEKAYDIYANSQQAPEKNGS